MNGKRNGSLTAIGAAAVAIGTGNAGAQPHDGEGTPIKGDALAKASQAALAFTGGGTVTGSEVGDEESLYEVEVTKADGSQVDAAARVVMAYTLPLDLVPVASSSLLVVMLVGVVRAGKAWGRRQPAEARS